MSWMTKRAVAGAAGGALVLGGGLVFAFGSGDDDGRAAAIGASTLPEISISDASTVEGSVEDTFGTPYTSVLEFTVTRAGNLSVPVSVNFKKTVGGENQGSHPINTGNPGPPALGMPSSGTLQFKPEETSKVIRLAVQSNRDFQTDQYFTVDLQATTEVKMVDGSGVGYMINDDPPVTDPAVSYVSVEESFSMVGDSTPTAGQVRFDLRRTGPTDQTAVVTWQAVPGEPLAKDPDWVAGRRVTTRSEIDPPKAFSRDWTHSADGRSGTVTMRPGVTRANIVLWLKPQPYNRVLRVKLTGATGVKINNAATFATIARNPYTPEGGLRSLRISDASVAEGQTGTTNAVFTVRREPNPNGTPFPASSLGYSVYTHNNVGTAICSPASCQTGTHPDYTPDYKGGPGSLKFLEGQATATISVPVIGDTRAEPDETFYVSFGLGQDSVGVGTILDDDGSAPATLAISDVTVPEANGGGLVLSIRSQVCSTLVPVDVTRSGSTVNSVFANVYINGLSRATNNLVHIPAGQRTATLWVCGGGSTPGPGPDRKGTLTLGKPLVLVDGKDVSPPMGATIADPTAVLTVTDK